MHGRIPRLSGRLNHYIPTLYLSERVGNIVNGERRPDRRPTTETPIMTDYEAIRSTDETDDDFVGSSLFPLRTWEWIGGHTD